MRTLSEDTSPEVEAEWIARLRRLTPGQRFQMAARLNDALRAAVTSRIRRDHPQASEEEIRLRVAATWLGPELARSVLGIEP
jgi:hypothetical protein